MSQKRVVIAGGSGFLGQHIETMLLEHGYEVNILSRHPSGERQLYWDGRTIGEWLEYIDGAYAVINLAGKTINCRYTEKNKTDILNSRLNSTSVLSEAILQMSNPPEVFVQASGLGIYGNTGDRIITEQCPTGKDFLANVCVQWEDTFMSVDFPQTRSVALRIGLVLAADGGVLPVFEQLVKFYLGGQAGNGKQYISWLHVKDFQHVMLDVIEHSHYSGVYNVTSPNPVTNSEFMSTLRKVFKRPLAFPLPEPLIHIGAFLRRTEASLVLEGRRCVPQRLLESKYEFLFKDLAVALNDIYPSE